MHRFAILKLRRSALVAGVGLVSLLAFVGSAYAVPTVWFYPPVGTWYSYGYPSGTAFLGYFTWSHDLETRTYRASGANQIYVYHYRHYNGSASLGSTVHWRNNWLVDGGSPPYDSKFTSAPHLWAMSNSWNITLNRYFGNETNRYAYGETRFGTVQDTWCQGVSTGMYGPV